MIVNWKSGIWLTSLKWLTDWMTVTWTSGIWLTLVKWLTEWLWSGSQEFDWRRWSDWLIEWLWPESHEFDVCVVTDCGLEVRNLICVCEVNDWLTDWLTEWMTVVCKSGVWLKAGTSLSPPSSYHFWDHPISDTVSEGVKAVSAWGQALDFQLAPTISVTSYVIPVPNFLIYFMLQCWESL